MNGSTSRLNFPVQLWLSPSPIFQLVMVVVHLLALSAVLLSEANYFLCVILLLTVCLSGVYSLRPSLIKGLRYDSNGWQISITSLTEPHWQRARLCGEQLVWPNLIVLNFDLGRVILLADSAEAESLHRLRVLLLAGGQALFDIE